MDLDRNEFQDPEMARNTETAESSQYDDLYQYRMRSAERDAEDELGFEGYPGAEYAADLPKDDRKSDNQADSPSEDLILRFSNLPDEEIVNLCHEGDNLAEEYLLDKYKNFVRSKARSYFLIGADHEDIVQEGMIGLYKAIRDYRPEKLSSFRVFAELCITRQIITAIKTATRQKHIPLNSYISLNKPLYDEESDRTLMDVIMEGRVSNPEEIFINREDLVNINEKIKEVLSGLEQEVLNAYLDGKSYQEIAESLGRHVKSIDNALQRVKRKLEKYLEGTDEKE